MSMLSEQANRLRGIAHSLELFPIHDFTATSNEIRQAADTIEALSAKLAVANMEQSDRYYSGGWIVCEDRLPKDMKDVLVFYKARIDGGTHDGEEIHNFGIGCYFSHSNK